MDSSDLLLRAALDHAFAERERPPYRRTKAVVILHDGNIVAERYASDGNVNTARHGWSLTKSDHERVARDPGPRGQIVSGASRAAVCVAHPG